MRKVPFCRPNKKQRQCTIPKLDRGIILNCILEKYTRIWGLDHFIYRLCQGSVNTGSVKSKRFYERSIKYRIFKENTVPWNLVIHTPQSASQEQIFMQCCTGCI